MTDKTELLKEAAYREAEETKARQEKEQWCREIGALILTEVDSGKYDILDAFNYWVRNVSKYGALVERRCSSLENFGMPGRYKEQGLYIWGADMFWELFDVYEVKTGRFPRPEQVPSKEQKENALKAYFHDYLADGTEAEFFATLRSLIEKGEKGFNLSW